MVRSLSAALVLTVATTGAGPTFPPLPVESAPPSPSAAGQPTLPEIGRVRSTRPGCIAIRDLVVPSFSSALKADELYATTVVPRLDKYAEINADPNAGVSRTAALHNLDRNVSTMLERAREIGRALGDPRVAASVGDPEVLQVRSALQTLFAAQIARAGALSQFVQRETQKDSLAGIGSTNAFNGSPDTGGAPAIPDVASTPLPGMPILHGAAGGLPLADRNNMNDWATAVRVQTRARENQAAKTFYTIAQSCR
ncbi:MAG: hypothetical protein JOZ24_03125 [Candidatus Eremiobacteraeota bacterium]|nr:hypothetical protein [Candidatus Eremiobacteraeota bacterium]